MFELSPRFLALAREACHKTAYSGREWGFEVVMRGSKTLDVKGGLVKGGGAAIRVPPGVRGFFHTHPSGVVDLSDSDIASGLPLIIVGTSDRKVGVFAGNGSLLMMTSV